MAAPVLAPQPIFAAIEAHRVAWGHPIKKEGAHDAKFERRHDAVMDAASVIIDTEPTTILGATARLRQT